MTCCSGSTAPSARARLAFSSLGVPTDDRTTDEVVEWIANDAGLTLVQPRMHPARYQLRRIAVGVRHIRI